MTMTENQTTVQKPRKETGGKLPPVPGSRPPKIRDTADAAVGMLDLASMSTAARVAAETGAVLAVEHHEDYPSDYGAKVAARLIGLYGWHLAAESHAWDAYAKRAGR